MITPKDLATRFTKPVPEHIQVAPATPYPTDSGKSWADIQTQVDKFDSRGLSLTPAEYGELRKILRTQNYYRFSGYFKQFYIPGEEKFEPGTDFRDLVFVYEQDNLLRQHLYVGLRDIELLLRTQIAYILCQHDPAGTAYLKRESYYPILSHRREVPADNSSLSRWQNKYDFWERTRKSLEQSITQVIMRKQPEAFIKRFTDKNENIPLWVMVEALSFGDLSKLLDVWKEEEEIFRIAEYLGFTSAEELRRATGNMSYLRNIVAHHGRLWGRYISREVANSPTKSPKKARKNNIDPYTGINKNVPLRIILLANAWVDHIRGNDDFSQKTWEIISAQSIYEEGMRRYKF